MKMTETNLRRLIRETLLTEASSPYYRYGHGALNSLADDFLKWMEASRKNPESFDTKALRKSLTSTIYDYYTHESSDVIHDVYKGSVEKLAAKDPQIVELTKWYNSLKSSLESLAKNVGWTSNDSSPSWFQLERVGRVSDGADSRKMYLTFNKFGPDGKISLSLYDNYKKLGKLLTAIAKAQKDGRFAGEVTFKISNNLLNSFRQKDSVVIHFKKAADRDVIESIVSGVGFDLVPRSAVGRTVFGVDAMNQATGKRGSDSELATEKAVQNIEKNKDLLEKLLKNPATRDSGLSGLKYIMDKTMEGSSHRGS
jgi:hypothetical protein